MLVHIRKNRKREFKKMWKTKNFNLQNVKVRTEKAVLIQMPHNSDYDGFCFWHPAKLVRKGSHSYEIQLSYTDEFNFKLIKNGKGRYNKFDVIEEKTISAEEFERI